MFEKWSNFHEKIDKKFYEFTEYLKISKKHIKLEKINPRNHQSQKKKCGQERKGQGKVKFERQKETPKREQVLYMQKYRRTIYNIIQYYLNFVLNQQKFFNVLQDKNNPQKFKKNFKQMSKILDTRLRPTL
eukprot:TRINITY_DN1195_c0_g4_i1.p3 TRINITY_DN1195_c0_g4~~TRINITY_DN1195_c0_g4_i1.p3  ORF type:complete len:131 (-),score=8.74 TRINITY_DN1195_c0_g4_i1:642-1034(-)